MKKERKNKKKIEIKDVKIEKNEKKLQVKKDGKKTSKSINRVLLSYLIEVAYIFIIEMVFKVLLGSFEFDWTLFRILLSSSFIGGLFMLITSNLKPKLRITLLVIFNFFIVFYAWLQVGLMDFMGTFYSMSNLSQGTKVVDYIMDFLRSFRIVVHLIYIPFILYIVYLVYERKITKDGYDAKIDYKNMKLDLIMVGLMLLVSLVYGLSIRVEFMQNKYQPISNKELFKNPSNISIAIKNYGSLVYLFLDFKSVVFGSGDDSYTFQVEDAEKSKTREFDDTVWKLVMESEKDSNYKKLNEYFINRPISEKNDHTGIFEGKNLIVLMLESVSYVVFDEQYKDYFPTLYKLQTEGISAVNNYSPRNSCATGDSQFTSETSLYSIETTCTVNVYRNNTYPEALMSMMRKNGYTTSAYHDYNDQYYYRTVFEPKMGSSEYYGMNRLGMTDAYIFPEWPSDINFIEKSLPKFIDEEHFASYMVTVSSHAPYAYNTNIASIYYSMFNDLNVSASDKRYLAKVKIVDLALEKLLNELEEKGILDDTVIVLFGDHYPYSLTDKEFASLATYNTSENMEVDRTPFIIYNSKTEKETITKYTSPLEITPTLLNMFGIEYDPRLYLGHDVFSDYTDYVIFPDHSWQSGYGFYSASKGQFLPVSEDKTLDDAEILRINKEVSDLRYMSGLAVKKDYFNYLFKKIDAKKEELEKEKEAEENDEKDSDSGVAKQDKDNK